MNARDRDRLPALDSLRAIAALAVLLFHYTSGYERVVGPHTGPVPNVEWGHLGVELFFVISGFVIAWTLERSSSLTDFTWGRLARLYPAYLAGAMITGIVVFGIGFNPSQIQTRDIAWNAIIGLPQLVKANNLDASYWTLGVEVSFYIMAAAATYALPKLRFEIFCLVWLAVSLAVRGFLPGHVRFQLLLVSNYSPLFVAGAMLFALSPAMRPDRLTVATFAAAIVVAFVGIEPHWLRPTSGAGVCVFVGLVFLTATGRLAILNFRPLVIIGQASYSLYLIHQVVGYWFIFNAERLGVPPIAAIAAATLLVISASIGLRTVVEVPAQRFIRNATRPIVGYEPRAAMADPLQPMQTITRIEGMQPIRGSSDRPKNFE
ncbi:MAG TPA: acyltransferase [Bradyrhizobium sp.]|uniref:acyltransferase family protein n=1 Tax=Bradyrhizobium sp. TaxID=376 RepID=UPI002D809F42|nr:acyltransferase [Bradyrhizobium sp.]HET7886759.1 acyltransferase [Bradyrhizobium sp.]